MLKLIINNSKNGVSDDLSRASPRKKILKPKVLLERLFLYDFREITSDIYVLRCQDFSHRLACEMTLERKQRLAYSECLEDDNEGYGFVTVIAGTFPEINIQKLIDKVDGDVFLQDIILTRFHLNLIEQLLLFCRSKDATHLIMTMDMDQLNFRDIYRDFVIFEDDVMTSVGEQREFIIPSDTQTYVTVVDCMNRLNKHLQKTLWREQKNNATMRNYLKFQSLLEFM
jgi:hypothetical protein